MKFIVLNPLSQATESGDMTNTKRARRASSLYSSSLYSLTKKATGLELHVTS